MKIALLCAMAFVTLSSVPFVAHPSNAVAEENTTAQIRTTAGIKQPTAPGLVQKLCAKSAKTKSDGRCASPAVPASRSAQ